MKIIIQSGVAMIQATMAFALTKSWSEAWLINSSQARSKKTDAATDILLYVY